MVELPGYDNLADARLLEQDTSAGHSGIHLAKVLRDIGNQAPVSATSVDGICVLRADNYVPLLCTALHDGSAFPAGLEKSCFLSTAERRFEEDPHTARLLEKLPLVLSGSESRYFYDLNRAEEYATLNDVFGRNVWRKGEHPEHRRAISRHRRFYRLAGALIEQLILQFGSCLVFDLHSYNGSKIARETPLFNLGTCANDPVAHRGLLDRFLGSLSQIDIPGVATRVAENDVFEGRGRFVNWVSRTYPQAVPICLEVKKDYCEERSGSLYPDFFNPLQAGLTRAIGDLFTDYRENYLQHLCPRPVII